MSTSEKKKKKRKKEMIPTSSESISHPSLPVDVLLNCIARVSRLYYPSLSLVSKSFRSLLASQELHQTRALVGHSENCLFVCLRFPLDPNPRWFTLCRVPDRKMHSSTGYLLVPIPSPSSRWSSKLVAVGSNIYKFGGDVNSRASSCVHVMDSRSHTWKEAPSMQVERNSSCTVSLVDGKIYVAGGCRLKSVNWIEVFDPKTQTWSSVTSPSAKIRGVGGFKSLGLGGKLYMFGDVSERGRVYSPNEGKWNPVGSYFNADIAEYVGTCVIDNVLFSAFRGTLSWYDSTVHIWRELNGLEDMPDFGNDCEYCKLVNHGGKMVMFWEGYGGSKNDKLIWCAEIELERRYIDETDEIDEIWVKVEWLDVVLTVPKSCHLSRMVALSTTV